MLSTASFLKSITYYYYTVMLGKKTKQTHIKPSGIK